jgi:hypothetical protein
VIIIDRSMDSSNKQLSRGYDNVEVDWRKWRGGAKSFVSFFLIVLVFFLKMEAEPYM